MKGEHPAPLEELRPHQPPLEWATPIIQLIAEKTPHFLIIFGDEYQRWLSVLFHPLPLPNLVCVICTSSDIRTIEVLSCYQDYA
jgi:hypothetical protein